MAGARPHGRGRELTRPLAVLGAGPAQLGAFRAARSLGIPTLALDKDERAYCLRMGLADAFAPVSTMDREGVERVVRRARAAGLIAPGTDGPVRIAAEIAARLELPHSISPAVAARATDKLSQRAAFAAAGVPQPGWSAVAPLATWDAAVIKPAAAQGQRGLRVVRAGGDVEGALRAARAASRDGRALCEELIAGREVTVNGWLLDSELMVTAVCDRERARGFGVATAHLCPAGGDVAPAVQAAAAACAALDLREGPVYVQVVLGAGGPCVMEVAARLGGGHDAEACAAATGVDLAVAAVRAALGLAQPAGAFSPTRRAASVVRFLLAPAGELRAVEGLEAARALPGLLDAAAYREPGHRFGEVTVGSDRAGFVLAAGADRPSAEATAARGVALVRFSVTA